MRPKQSINQSRWTEQQRIKYQNADNQLEKEKILYEIQSQIEKEDYHNQILKQNPQVSRARENLERFSDDESEDSIKSNEDEFPVVKPKPEPEVLVSKSDEQFEGYFMLMHNVILKRSQVSDILIKLYNYHVIEGAFVRLSETSKKYALAQVIQVEERDKSYSLDQSQTFKILKLQFAEYKEPKYRQITQVSNQKVENHELVVWKKKCEENGISTPTKDWLLNKYKEIQNALTSQPSEDQKCKKIYSLIDKWTGPSPSNIHYHDLGSYKSFLQNQISQNNQTIDNIDESIADIQEQYPDQKPPDDEFKKIIDFNNRKLKKQDEIRRLKEYVEKISNLINHHQEVQLSKQRPSSQYQSQTVSKSRLGHKDEALNQLNLQYQREKDQKYIRKFEGLEKIQGSENFKMHFLSVHDRDLEIDDLIDNIMAEE